MKKLLVLALALVLALGCVYTAQAAEGPVAGLYYPDLPNNELHITVNSANFGTDQLGTRMMALWEEKMEEYLGIDIVIDSYSNIPLSDFRSNEAVNLAANELADINTYSQSELVNEYGAEGIVLDINKYSDYLVYYPEFVAGCVGGQEGINNADGSSYVFWDGYDNDVDMAGAQSFTAFAYRFDVLKANDLEPATTWDEFKDLCAELKALIDDGTVEADYVMSGTKGYAFYRGMVGIFHTWDTTYWNGEEWSFGPIEDNFRALIKDLNEFWELGYIDPEYQTDDSMDAKAENGSVLLTPTLWAGYPQIWNAAAEEGIEWGLAYLPTNEEYGTAWKWGSKLTGKNLGTTRTMGIIISAATEYPEWVVSLVDYQYSEDIYLMLNWGEEGIDYYVDEEGMRQYTDKYMALPANERAQALADEGIMSSASARTGIPFVPQIFSTIAAYSASEPWWSAEKGYYEGHYWYESAKIGGPDSVSPYDRAPILNLSEADSKAKSEMTTACEKYAKTEVLKFIQGEYDIDDDAAWESYVAGVKSQWSDFDELFERMNEASDLDSLKYYEN